MVMQGDSWDPGPSIENTRDPRLVLKQDSCAPAKVYRALTERTLPTILRGSTIRVPAGIVGEVIARFRLQLVPVGNPQLTNEAGGKLKENSAA